MIKKWSRWISVWILLLFTTGCWDYKDIDKKSIINSIGVDKVHDKIQFSGEIAKLITNEPDKEKTQSRGVYNALAYGKDFEEGRINFDSVNPYPTFLGATRVVVFGTNLAKEGIEPYLNRINKFYDYRKTLLTVVSREIPKELFEIKTDKDISVGFLIEDILNSLSDKSMALYSNVGELLSDIALGDVGYMLPYVGIEDGTIKYLGLAVMKDSKLVGIIEIKNTDGILYLLADNPVLTEVLSFPENEKNKYSFRTSVKKRKIKTRYRQEKVVIDIALDIGAELQYQYYIEPISDEQIKELENMISQKIKMDILNIFKRSQKEFDCDIFGFARYFRGDHPKIYKKIKWEDEYKNAQVNVTVKTKIKNLGLIDTNAKKKY